MSIDDPYVGGGGSADPMSQKGLDESDITMAGMKRKVISHDFVAKENDAIEVRNALTMEMPDFQGFLKSLTVPQFEEFQSFVMRNKNMDRVLEYTVSQMTTTKALDMYNETQTAWIAARCESGRAKILKTVGDLFATNFMMKSGRWDVEGLKITLAEFHRDADRMGE